MIRALLIDDEESNTENLRILLQKYCPNVEIVGIANSAAAARECLSTTHPDLLFVDIQMPGEDGITFLKSLTNIGFEVIFVTAHDTYGIQAAKISAIDYLLKPVVIPELAEAVLKATKRIEQRQENSNLKNLLQYVNGTNSSDQKIALPSSQETLLIATKDIIRVESDNAYTFFFTTSGKKIVVSKPLKFYDELLGAYGFLRIHQSHLVNRAHVKSIISRDGCFLKLSDETEIPVSRQKKEYVKRIFLNT